MSSLQELSPVSPESSHTSKGCFSNISSSLRGVAKSIKSAAGSVLNTASHPFQTMSSAASVLASRMSPFQTDIGLPAEEFRRLRDSRPPSAMTITEVDDNGTPIGSSSEYVNGQLVKTDDIDDEIPKENSASDGDALAIVPVRSQQAASSWSLRDLSGVAKLAVIGGLFFWALPAVGATATAGAVACTPETCALALPAATHATFASQIMNLLSSGYSYFTVASFLKAVIATVVPNFAMHFGEMCGWDERLAPSSTPALTNTTFSLPNLPETIASWAEWANGGLEAFVSWMSSKFPDMGFTNALQAAAASVGNHPTVQQAAAAVKEMPSEAIAWAKANIKGFPTAWDYVSSVANNAATITSKYPYLLAIVLAAAIFYKIKHPSISVTSRAPDCVIHSRQITCKQGTFKVDLPIPKDLTNAQAINTLFEDYVEQHLEKNTHPMQIGDKLETSLNKDASGALQIQYKLVPKDPTHYVGRETDLEKIVHVPSDEFSRAKNETMYKIMTQGAKDSKVIAELLSTKTEKLPLNAASVAPIGFNNPDRTYCTLNSIMQAMLSVESLRNKMKTCSNAVLKQVATEYEDRMRTGNGNPLDLTELRKQFAPTVSSRWRHTGGTDVDLRTGQQDAHDYFNAILFLIGNTHMQSLYVKRLTALSTLNAQQNVLPKESKAIIEQNINTQSPCSPEIYIHMTSQTAQLDLQEAFNASLRGDQPNATDDYNSTYVNTSPDVLPIHIGRWIQNPDGSLAAVHDPFKAVSETLTWPAAHILANGAQDETYELQSFTVHQGGLNAGHEVAYVKTTELINGTPTSFYWKINDMDNGSKPRGIEQTEYLEAAKLSDNLMYVKQSQPQYIAARFDQTHQPLIHEVQRGNERALLETSDGTNVLNSPASVLIPLNLAALPSDANQLKTAVHTALDGVQGLKMKAAFPILEPEQLVSANPYRTMGIIWYAIQEYQTKHPGRFDEIKLRFREGKAITRDESKKYVEAVDMKQSFPDVVKKIENMLNHSGYKNFIR